MRCFVVVVFAMLAVAEEPRLQEQPIVDPIVSRFLARVEVPLREYKAIRLLKSGNAWMAVETILSPERTLRIEVLAEGGNLVTRYKGLRAILEGEAQALKTNPAAHAYTLDNYELRALGKDETLPGIMRIQAKALRKDKLLINGTLYVSEGQEFLLRTQGRLSANYSFFTRNVEGAITFARIAGAQVPIRAEGSADIRFFGRHEFTMEYSYISVNGNIVTEDVARTMAPFLERTNWP